MGYFDYYPKGNFYGTRSNYPTAFILCSLERGDKNLLNETYFTFLHKIDQTVLLFFKVNLIIVFSCVMLKNGQ